MDGVLLQHVVDMNMLLKTGRSADKGSFHPPFTDLKQGAVEASSLPAQWKKIHQAFTVRKSCGATITR